MLVDIVLSSEATVKPLAAARLEIVCPLLRAVIRACGVMPSALAAGFRTAKPPPTIEPRRLP
jgi:hypothetical protein